MMMTVHTVGHSTRTIEALVDVLTECRIQILFDVRTFPRSRRHPQFNRDALETTLATRGIGYAWRGEALGGFRKAREESRHTALREPAFRGFADHMETGVFKDALTELIECAETAPVAIMCAERDPAQCHRALISDAVLIRGARVIHLIEPGERREARLSPLARIEGETLVYDGGQPRLLDDR
jgi:uncharacterized protein (DUF488 family)